ncbi:hypothetical protein [Thiocystis minor]|uniref:hypothetical protein n=1 Tax=Thiocystis minor TaxID=61597 RepID=UPI00191163BA|nr:hypothetical protein [Thiocystis minor]
MSASQVIHRQKGKHEEPQHQIEGHELNQWLGLPEIHVGLKGSPGTDDHEQDREDQQDRRSDPGVQ